MKIRIDDEELNVVIVRKKVKNIYFRFNDNNELVVSAPLRVSDKYILELIKENYNSIKKMYGKVSKRKENDTKFSYLGNSYVVIYDESIKSYVIEGEYITFKNEREKDKFLASECKKVFRERINYLKPYISYVPEFKLRIRKMKTRWGVCNRKDNIITLNSELIKKDVSLIDYVIIHEMCHFKEGNHSKRFWDEVSKYYPNYKVARKRLRSE